MKNFRILTTLFVVLAMPLFNSCSEDSQNHEDGTTIQNVAFKTLSIPRASREETIKKVAYNIYTMSTFMEKNIEVFNKVSSDMEKITDDKLNGFLVDNGFTEINLIDEISKDYTESIESLRFYIDEDKAKYKLQNDEETPTFKGLVGEIGVLFPISTPPYENQALGCLENWKLDMQACRESFYVNSAYAIGSAAFGLAPGLLAAGYAMASYVVCKRAADRSYQAC